LYVKEILATKMWGAAPMTAPGAGVHCDIRPYEKSAHLPKWKPGCFQAESIRIMSRTKLIDRLWKSTSRWGNLLAARVA